MMVGGTSILLKIGFFCDFMGLFLPTSIKKRGHVSPGGVERLPLES
jgi:hypothetical protein